jgi:hypothetical protein
MLRRISIVIAVLIFASLVSADDAGFDDHGNPNDPRINERANACYEGGTMEDRCRIEFDWQVGWYLIRLQFGLLSREQVPSWVLSDEVVNTCAFTWNPNYYVDFSHSNFINSGNYWGDPDCTIYNGNLGRNWVYSPSGQANAESICIANLGTSYIAIPSEGPFVFECV